MKPVSRTHFHAPNWHSYDGKPAEVALATAVRKVGEFQPDAEPALGPRTQKPLWNRTCAEKMSWCLRCHLYWENSSSAWSSTARSWSLCVLVSQLKNNLPWQEFPKRKYLRLWGSRIHHCWGRGSTWYGGNLVPERAAGLEKTSDGQKQNWTYDTEVFMFDCLSLVSERNGLPTPTAQRWKPSKPGGVYSGSWLHFNMKERGKLWVRKLLWSRIQNKSN